MKLYKVSNKQSINQSNKKTEMKATCKGQNESSCNACRKTEPVTSEGDAGEVDWDPVNGNDEFAKDQID
jgi:hypothetical protein